MSKLILLRHGKSYWNKKNIFTGWVDVPLAPEGIEEALSAGGIIKDIPIDAIFTSTLVRAQMTAFLAMSQHSSNKVPVVVHPGEGLLDVWGKIHSQKVKEDCIPVIYSEELNERMYGDLQGLDKEEVAREFGADQVKIWRRSFDIAPPNGESLAMTAARAIPYFNVSIIPLLTQEFNILVAAHGNSLRSICMELDKLTQEEVLNFEIPTGIPIVYEYQKGVFTRL